MKINGNSDDFMQHIASGTHWTPDALREQYGSPGAFASALSGTSDRKSLAYKAALRNIERWKKGTRKPSKATQEKLNDLGKGQFATNPKKITLNGNICINGYGGKYCRDREIKLSISDDDWDLLQEQAENEDIEGFMATLGQAYGGSVEFIDIEKGTIDLG